MANLVSVAPSWKTPLADFLQAADLPLVISDQPETGLRLETAVDRREAQPAHDGRPGVLYISGWISCAAARRLAEQLSFTYGQAGRLLDFLDIKVKNCDLECF